MAPTAGVLRFGIAGLGVASNQILAGFVGKTHLQVTAAADIRPNALEAFATEFEAEVYTSVDEMCQSANVDAIYVCSPNHLHCEHVLAAARHGKHAIVEKPMALSIEECERMNEAAERNGVTLLCGHTKSFDAPIRKMRELVVSGKLGKLGMIQSWNYNQFMYRPRMPHELDPERGGNVVFNQGPHQMDIIRLIGGGMVRSVRGMTGIWDPTRRAEGAWTAYVEFEDGTPATSVYNGYGHFHTGEFTSWVGEGGQPTDPQVNFTTRARLLAAADETTLKEAERYAGATARPHGQDGDTRRVHQPTFGLTLVSCEHGDIRQSPDGLYVYGDDGMWEEPVSATNRGREAELEELYQAVVEHRPAYHDGRWGEATLEVVLAIMQSAKERREITMQHQVPSPE
jgi:phthalate 4,5-cis-dihydrodiol dehydrogenase